jgi:hypothetical protein
MVAEDSKPAAEDMPARDNTLADNMPVVVHNRPVAEVLRSTGWCNTNLHRHTNPSRRRRASRRHRSSRRRRRASRHRRRGLVLGSEKLGQTKQ